MANVTHVQAAIAWLKHVEQEIIDGVEHDYDLITVKVHTFLHYGPTLGKPAPVEPADPAAPAAGDTPKS